MKKREHIVFSKKVSKSFFFFSRFSLAISSLVPARPLEQVQPLEGRRGGRRRGQGCQLQQLQFQPRGGGRRGGRGACGARPAAAAATGPGLWEGGEGLGAAGRPPPVAAEGVLDHVPGNSCNSR